MHQRIIFETSSGATLSVPAEEVLLELEKEAQANLWVHETGINVGGGCWCLHYDSTEEARQAFNWVNILLSERKPLVYVPKRGFLKAREDGE